MINGLLGVIIGLFIGYQAFRIRDLLSQTYAAVRPKKETEPSVVSTDSPLAKRVQSEAKDSAVIIPKSPQLLDFEENEELRRMNPGA